MATAVSGLIGRKLGMTQVYTAAGVLVPVTVIEAGPCTGVATRNAERNGLITVTRNSYNNYRLFGRKEIERLRIIRMLTKAGYSHMAILRMFIELDRGNTRDLKKTLDTPRPDEDIFSAADRWLTTLHEQEKMARQVIQLIEDKLFSNSS